MHKHDALSSFLSVALVLIVLFVIARIVYMLAFYAGG